LIIVDGEFCGKDCEKVFSRIKASEATRNIQIMLLTTRPHFEEQVEGQDFMVDDFLIKPINGHELRLRVKALLKKKAYLDQIKADPKGDFFSSITDKPSGLYNLFYLKHFLDREIKRCLRDSLQLSLALLNFSGCWSVEDSSIPKNVDEFLGKIGCLIFQNIREVDFCARGGEKELIIVFPNTSREGVMTPVERIKAKILEELALPSMGQSSPNLSKMSIGIAVFPNESDSPTELIIEAKKALRVVESNSLDAYEKTKKSVWI
jgi:two-component system cell cycle response regulator